jgi:TPR repeat protein
VSGTLALSAVRKRMIVAWALALGFGMVASQTANYAHGALPRPRPLEELSYYPSGRHLGPAMLGHSESAADLAWLRAVQYYGEHRATDNRFDRMDHVFDILTSLAPHFLPAYVFGAFALAQEGGDFQRAEALMLKGLAANPTSGPLAFQMGFLYYVRPGGRDLDHAAEYFEQAARQADAPPQSARFAAYAHQVSGDLQVAYSLWSDVRQNSPNRYLRDIADREMRRIRRALELGRKDLAVDRLGTPVVRFR